MDEGFIDLRQNHDAGTGSDSFWPSFTDIMMVVVMIFMIASTVLMLRNWELVEKLRATIEAEYAAMALARSASETSATLEEQLAQAQHANTEMRMQLMRVTERNDTLSEQLSGQEQQLLELETDNQKLAASLQKYRFDALLNDDQLKQARDEVNTLQQRVQQVLDELTGSEEAKQKQAKELAALRLGNSLTEQQLLSIQNDYSELQIKYDKLFQPARSAQGKHVVTVRYWKEGKLYHLRIKDLDEEDYRVVSREELHRQLAALKEKYKNQLYVKLIIPDDSGLSYNEAWGFTVEILDKYDYYHQK
jgi:CII-binding regulator of phage lambda lysogenization HflD